MGVPKFFSWLNARSREKGAFKGVVLNRPPKDVSSVAIDMNGMIHTARAIVYGTGKEFYNPKLAEEIKYMRPVVIEAKILEVVTALIMNVIRVYLPRDALILTIDGPTNVAKIIQQKGRRYRSAALSNGQFPDGNEVTPGTNFMIRLDKFLRAWMKRSRHRLPPTLIYSSHLVPGEGEHKIMSYYRSGKLNPQGIHVVYGLDADLIMLTMLSPLEKIFLSREDARQIIDIQTLRGVITTLAKERQKATAVPDFVALTYLLGNDFLPHGPSHNSMYVLVEALLKAYHDLEEPLVFKESKLWRPDLKQLGRIVKRMYPEEIEFLAKEASTEIDTRSETLRTLSQSLINLKSLDMRVYDPELKVIVTTLESGYNSIQGVLPHISQEFVRYFTKELKVAKRQIKKQQKRVASQEVTEETPQSVKVTIESGVRLLTAAESFRQQLISLTSVYPNRFFEKAVIEGTRTFDYSNFRGAWYDNALGIISSDSKVRNLMSFAIPSPGVDSVEEMCVRYVEGMVWCLRYYQTSAVDSRWFYPFSYPPLMKDLGDYLENLPPETEQLLSQRFAVPFSLGYGALEQLLAVIPPYSRFTSVPTMLHGLMMDSRSPIIDLFPKGIVIDADGIPIDDTHLFVPRIPMVDMDRIIEAVKDLHIPPDAMKLWVPATTEMIPMLELELKEYRFYQKHRTQRRKEKEAAYQASLQEEGSSVQGSSRGGSSRGGSSRGGSSRGGSFMRGLSRGTFTRGASRGSSSRGTFTQGSFRGKVPRNKPLQGPPTVSVAGGIVAGSSTLDAGPRLRPEAKKSITGTQVPKSNPKELQMLM